MKRLEFKTLAVYLAIVIALVGGGVLTAHIISPLLVELNILPNDKIVDYHTYYSIDPEITDLIWDEARIVTEYAPLYENEKAYLPLPVVRERMDPFIFMDENADMLFITSRTDVLEYNSENFLNKDGTVYVPAELLMRHYPYRIEYHTAYNLLTIDQWTNSPPNMARIIKRTGVRYNPASESELALEVQAEDIVTVYASSGDYTQIRTQEGIPGYVLTADIEPLTAAEADLIETPEMPAPVSGYYIDNTGDPLPNWPGEKINMMWDGVYSESGNNTKMNEPLPAGVNVLSPTWYELDGENYQLISYASADYISWAHEQGVSVWPRIMDGGYERSRAVLTDAALRKSTIEKICSDAETLGFDGVNIDFETVYAEDGDYFIQFLRELSANLGDKVLSVDVLVPQEWSEYYRRGDIAKFADFLCVMAYDEHHQSSEVSGPVASLPFVSKGVEDMLAIMPKEKLIMGLPFYNRVWVEVTGTGEVKETLHYGMENTKQLLIDNGVTEPEWDEGIGSFYGQYAYVEENETLMNRVWLEDENSIREKLKIFTDNDLAGVAGWSRGFENAAVHELLRTAVN